jgi:hypothetical protein
VVVATREMKQSLHLPFVVKRLYKDRCYRLQILLNIRSNALLNLRISQTDLCSVMFKLGCKLSELGRINDF